MPEGAEVGKPERAHRDKIQYKFSMFSGESCTRSSTPVQIGHLGAVTWGNRAVRVALSVALQLANRPTKVLVF